MSLERKSYAHLVQNNEKELDGTQEIGRCEKSLKILGETQNGRNKKSQELIVENSVSHSKPIAEIRTYRTIEGKTKDEKGSVNLITVKFLTDTKKDVSSPFLKDIQRE